MKSKDVNDKTKYELTENFAEYINNAADDILIKSYKNDILSDEDIIGKFRIIYEYDNVAKEYITFIVQFFEEDERHKKLLVFCVEKKEVILKGSYDTEICSWSFEYYMNNSKLVRMATKIKRVLM